MSSEFKANTQKLSHQPSQAFIDFHLPLKIIIYISIRPFVDFCIVTDLQINFLTYN